MEGSKARVKGDGVVVGRTGGLYSVNGWGREIRSVATIPFSSTWVPFKFRPNSLRAFLRHEFG